MILINSICLAIYDYEDRKAETRFNKILNVLSSVFAFIFAVEALVKIMAMGFVRNKQSYLRNAWNILDFVLMLIGYVLSWVTFYRLIELFLFAASIDNNNFNINSFRGLRVLRPLKTVNAIPNMRKLVRTLAASLNELLNVIVFI